MARECEWFRESVVKQVGDGSETFFWTDPWIGGSPLCEMFECLFDMAENKTCTVAEMSSSG
ncbi:cytochrome P450, partial [Trifolium medium]|nr:cytochrome P450 [Trifolium medium]